ncbi:MAG: hypothetical protein EBQ89_05525, partial [Alphaproteobacteria bacterium]|nr:hypothetical protein [Alphaproteobacteria bacterium]
TTQGQTRGVMIKYKTLPAQVCRQFPTRFAAAADDIKFFCARVGTADWLPSEELTELNQACGDDPQDVGLVFGFRP